MSEVGRFSLTLEQGEGYAFTVKFDWPRADELLMDEPPPLGEQAGPNASRLLAAAVGNCLSASLMFCLSKEMPPDGAVNTQVTARIVRNESKRMRIGGLDVELRINGELADSARIARCLKLFEDFCTVSASVRQGIPINVSVLGPDGALLHRDDGS